MAGSRVVLFTVVYCRSQCFQNRVLITLMQVSG